MIQRCYFGQAVVLGETNFGNSVLVDHICITHNRNKCIYAFEALFCGYGLRC